MLKKSKIKIHLVGGARPNFIKLSPLLSKLECDRTFETKFINTGQHYDFILYEKILKDLGLRSPDVNLGVGSCSSNTQISRIMFRYEKYLTKNRPDIIMVFGDVNSTLAAALTAKKMGVKLGHVEAGLRCYDESLPEEVNRRITDSISDFLFTPSVIENQNLKHENINKNIFFVGNIMIDSLKIIMKKNKMKPHSNHDYGLVTFHRPENVDFKNQLSNILDKLREISKKIPLVFSVHPRTIRSLKKFKLLQTINSLTNIKLYNSLGYLDFLNYLKHCKFVISDSGGVQEESSFLGIPCYTLRKSTERPITIKKGTNILVNVNSVMKKMISIKKKRKIKIDKWDGNTSSRIVNLLKKI